MKDCYLLSHKLKLVLDNFLQQNSAPSCDSYIELLLTHLSDDDDSSEGFQALRDPYTLEWVDVAIRKLQDEFNQMQPAVISFIVKVVTLLFQKKILPIRSTDVFQRFPLHNILVDNQTQLTPSMKLAHTRLLAEFANSSVGLDWIISEKCWRCLLKYCIKNHTVYVIRETSAAIYKILYELSKDSENNLNCIEMLEEILHPISSNVYDDSTLMINIDDSNLQRHLEPTLDLVSFILEKTVENEERTQIAYWCINNFQLNSNLWKLAKMTHNKLFLFKIMKALSCINFVQLVYEKCNGGKIAPSDFNHFGVTFFNCMKFCVERKAHEAFIKLAELNHVLWHKLGPRAPEEILIENERIQFENQIILFHLLPVLLISKPLRNEEFACSYILKLFSISCEYTHRICYLFRDSVYDSREECIILAHKSINVMISMESILNKTRAVLIFQAMCHTLKAYANKTETVWNKTEWSLLILAPNVLHAILVGLQTLIKKFRITWKESIETTCLLNLLLDLLDSSELCPRISVQAIKLTQLSIEHFLSPNMALLVDNLEGSGLKKIGPIIMKRFHDSSWEIRDSILELVTAIASISLLKYPIFQQYILDHQLGPQVFVMAQTDSEPYVQASALKCLEQMICINIVWEHALNQLNIAEYLMKSIRSCPEGNVRKESVSLLCKIYNVRGIDKKDTQMVFSTMAHCAVNDLHWEVRINALYFWKLEMCCQFTNQGMIDGNFPTVTFSKEHKKIVNLTEDEIIVRIKKILIELSSCGCLGVIMACLDDDCDIEVVKIAILVIEKFLKVLTKYDFFKLVEIPQELSSPELAGEQRNKKREEGNNATQDPINKNADSVIESIVTSNDINLLSKAYESQLNVTSKDENELSVDEHYYEQFAAKDPTKFIHKIFKLDLESLINGTNQHMSHRGSLNYLFDDIIYSIRPEGYDADCY